MPLDFEIAATGEADIEEAGRFLRKTFGVAEDWPPFRDDVLRWKALTPHPLWAGSRGYVIRRRGEIMAHGCAMPTRFVHAGGEALVACVVDWAANKAMPGGGALIYQHVGKFADGLIGVGGSDDAQRVLPRMGFQVRQQLETCARVTRPMARLLGTREKTWKDVARFGRNVAREMRRGRADASRWRARRVERFDESVVAVLAAPGVACGTICVRSPGILNYFLECPAARMEGYLLEREGVLSGYFVLAFVREDCRIAEIWVNSAKPQDWAAAYEAAGSGRSGSQLTVGCGTLPGRKAADLAGYHLSVLQPVYVKDPAGKLPVELDANLGSMDTDGFYL